MKKYRVIKLILCVIIVISFFAIIYNMYYIYINNGELEETILEEYKYDKIQEMVVDEEDNPMFLHYDENEMLKINSDFQGWLYIPDTPINYPVVQGENNDYYLYRSFEKEYSVFGSIFMMAGVEHNADNIILHGHNMGHGREEMFSSLLNYRDIEYAKKHNIIYYSHIENDEISEYEVFAVLDYNFYNPQDFYYMVSNFADEAEHKEYIDYLVSQSIYKTDIEYSICQQLLILSTCSNITGDDNRLLVCAIKNN